MVWLVETVQEVTDVTICLDNPKLEVIKAGAAACRGRILINSTTAKEPDLTRFMTFAAERGASIIGLTIDEKGVPNSPEARLEIGVKILTSAMEHGISTDRVYIDPITLPINVAQDQPRKMLKAIEQFTMLSDPPPHIVIGLSNLSQRCKEKSLLNGTFLAMCISAGLDAAIMDPEDEELMNAMITAEVLMNKSIYSDDYLKAYRA
jgi:5-methyltetrahydrofolate corrinoid/iron sulfur protein methyltransferase